jgi:spermidine/putrescine transport system ATP-binding protein
LPADPHLKSELPDGSAGPADFAIEARSLCRRFGTTEALADVSLQIRSGEFFSLLGPSGCGKTTLLRMIAGLDIPDRGTLQVCGQDMAGIPAHKRPVNTVFQSYALFPHLTARDNVAFGLRMKKIPRPEIEGRVTRVMALVQIAELADRRPAQLSGGEKQRVALARAIVNEPKVLLLDEPLGALDLKLRKQLQIELHQLQRRLGITFVHVTHDQDEALAISDRIAVMNAGRVQQIATAEELYERPRTRFVAQFVGACNLLEGKILEIYPSEIIVQTAAGNFSALRRETAPGQPGQDVVLAIRPEKVRLSNEPQPFTPNQIKASVEELIYGGAETQYMLRSGSQQLCATLLNITTGEPGFAAGDTLVCTLAPSALLVLAR